MNDKILSIIIKAQDQASKVMEHVGDKASQMGDFIARSMKIAAVALASGAVASTAFAIKSAASFEQTRIGIENMLGSADKAREVLRDVSKFASTTPFEFPELAGSIKQLLAFGFGADDAIKTMKELGDISAAIGAPIGDLSYLMGTLRTQGRAFTVDLRQFASRGIPIYEYLAKVLHTNESAIIEMTEAGKIGFPEVQKAFEAMTGEGGKFHGTMIKQSKSLSGLWSTLKDNIGLAGRELVGITQEGDIKAGSLFDKLRTATAELIVQLDKIDWNKVSNAAMNMAVTVVQQVQIATAAVKTFGTEAIATMQQLWSTFTNLTPIIILTQFIQQVFVPAAMAIWSAISQNLVPAFGDLWQSVTRLWAALNPGLGDALKIVAAIAGGLLLAAVYLITGAINLFVQGLAILITTLSNVINWISNLISWFGNLVGVVVNTIRTIVTIFSNLIPAARDVVLTVGGIFAGLGGMILRSIGNFGGLLYDAGKSLINGMVNGIRDALGNVSSTITGGIRGALHNAKIPGFATGGYTGEGGTNEIAGVVHKGEYVVPRQDVDQTTGLPKVGGANIKYNFYGNIVLATPESVDRFAERFEMPNYGVGI